MKTEKNHRKIRALIPSLISFGAIVLTAMPASANPEVLKPYDSTNTKANATDPSAMTSMNSPSPSSSNGGSPNSPGSGSGGGGGGGGGSSSSSGSSDGSSDASDGSDGTVSSGSGSLADPMGEFDNFLPLASMLQPNESIPSGTSGGSGTGNSGTGNSGIGGSGTGNSGTGGSGTGGSGTGVSGTGGSGTGGSGTDNPGGDDTGIDVITTATAIPEPTSVTALAILGLIGVIAKQRQDNCS